MNRIIRFFKRLKRQKRTNLALLFHSDGYPKFVHKDTAKILDDMKIKPSGDNLSLYICRTCQERSFANKRCLFFNEYEACFFANHDIEPLQSKSFTESKKYFETIEEEALERGEWS